MEDATGFFANVFGGERFMDYVSIFTMLLVIVVIARRARVQDLSFIRKGGYSYPSLYAALKASPLFVIRICSHTSVIIRISGLKNDNKIN
jgi:hypothetical protein